MLTTSKKHVCFRHRRAVPDGGLVMPAETRGLVVVPVTRDVRNARALPEAVAKDLHARGIATLSVLREPCTERVLEALHWARSEARLHPIGLIGWGRSAAAIATKAAAMSPATVRALAITPPRTPEGSGYLRLLANPPLFLPHLEGGGASHAATIAAWFTARLTQSLVETQAPVI